MAIRIFLGLLLTAGLGALGVIYWLATHGPAPHAAPMPTIAPTAQVLVSSHLLHAGSLIHPQDLAAHAYPRDAMATGAILDTPAARVSLAGALLRVGVPEGGLLLPSEMVLPGDHSYLAAVLTPGARAVSVGVDAISGNAGLVWPGDHVDLLLTQTLDDSTVAPAHHMATETVLAGLRVIATDQDLVHGELPTSSGAATRTITLEATPDQAQRIAIASQMGRLSLSLNAVDGTAPGPVPRPVWSGDVSTALASAGGKPKTATTSDDVHLFDGTTDAKDFHF